MFKNMIARVYIVVKKPSIIYKIEVIVDLYGKVIFITPLPPFNRKRS